MNASVYEGRSRNVLRIGLASIVGVQVLMETATLHGLIGDAHFVARRPVLLRIAPLTPVLLWSVYALVVVSLVQFARNRAPIRWGTVALLAMAAICQWGVELFGTPSRNMFFPAGAFFGWVLGLAYARTLRDRPPALDDALGEAGAMGVFAALYTGSGVSKLIRSGLGWMNPHDLRFLILSQHGVGDFEWAESYRSFILNHPRIAFLSSVITLVVEFGGFFLLAGKRMRVVWGLAILFLHLNIIVVATMPYLEPMALVLLFCIPWSKRDPSAAAADRYRVDRVESLFPRRILVGFALMILACYLLPVGWSGQEGEYGGAPPPAHS